MRDLGCFAAFVVGLIRVFTLDFVC